MKVYFILAEMTFLRYFMPLVIEATKRGHECEMVYGATKKYNSPTRFKPQLISMSKAYGFKLTPINLFDEYKAPGVVFVVEGVWAEAARPLKMPIVSLTYMRDFSQSFNRYKDIVDMIVMPSKFMAEYYNCVSPKNVYLGSPKYDIQLDEQAIRQKYETGDGQCALVLFPNLEYLKNANLPMVYGVLKDLGYKVLVKSRGKHSAPKHLRGDMYFEDTSWFPHTAMELMHISKIVVNFGSTGIKECVMLCRPWINFNTKDVKTMFSFLYKYPYCRELPLDCDFTDCRRAISELTAVKHGETFKRARKNHLFDSGNVSEAILKRIGL